MQIAGLVSDPVELTAEDLAAGHETEVLLACTSGWYTAQEWGGIRVADLLDAAGETAEDAAYVQFTSVTGYRGASHSMRRGEALLATHVSGGRLSHDHGALPRLVAPGRRGFQWVKWVTQIEFRSEYDVG